MPRSDSVENARRGGVVMLLGQAGNTVISLISIVVLSRLLAPSDFGLVAMVGVLSTLGTMIRDLGLTVSALRAPSLSHQQASNVFWVNGGLSLVSATLVAVSGHLMARIYGDPAVATITPFMALAVLFGGLQAQVQVQLARQQRYRALSAIGVGSNVLGLCVAITGAWLGFGYWALVAQNLVTGFSSLIAKFVTSRWVPVWWKRRSGTRTLVTSGLNYTGTTVVNMFADSAPSFFIGVSMGADEVGLYGRADQLIRMPMKFVVPLVNVALPGLNALRDAGKPLGPYVVRLQSIMSVAFALFIVPLAASAPSLFPAVLGPQWVGAAPAARALALGGVALAMSQVNYWTFLVAARSTDLLKFNLVAKPFTVLLVAVGSSISLVATSVSLSISSVAAWVWGVYWLRRKSGYAFDGLLVNGVRVLVVAGVALASGMLVGIGVSAGMFFQIVLEISVSVFVFVGLMAATSGGRNELAATWKFVGRTLKTLRV